MSASFGPRLNKSRSPANENVNRSQLKINKSELTKLKVAIKRSGLIATGPDSPLERDIDDPAKICPHVHFRKGNPPRVPIFGNGIKVNQDFSEDRTVFTHDKSNRFSRRSRSRSRSRSDRYRSRSKDRSRNERRSKSRDRSRSNERRRRSRERNKKRSVSRKRSTSRYRSRSRERRYSPEKRSHRDSSRERPRRSRSRSPSVRNHEPDCPMYKSSHRHRRRSITPLRPGEYRPGHPDLALRNVNRKSRSRSRSPRSSSKGEKSNPSTSRERRSRGRSRSRKSPSPYRDRRRSKSRHRSSTMPMPGMEYGYFDGFAPLPIHPFRGRFPMVEPGFYPRMYAPNLLMPRMPMNPMMRMPRQRWPIYNSGAVKSMSSKPATKTSTEEAGVVIIEHPTEETENNGAVSSSDKLDSSSTSEVKQT